MSLSPPRTLSKDESTGDIEIKSLMSTLGKQETVAVLKRSLSKSSLGLEVSSISRVSSLTSIDSGFSERARPTLKQKLKNIMQKRTTIERDNTGRKQDLWKSRVKQNKIVDQWQQ